MSDGPETAARRFAREYLKATGLPVRVISDRKHGPLTEEGYVHWLETELARARNQARQPEPERRPTTNIPVARPPLPPRR
jgi:hypothetical protein